MTDLQIELTKLIGSKELSFGCLIKLDFFGKIEYQKMINETKLTDENGIYLLSRFKLDGVPNEIIGHPAKLSDIHKFILNIKDTANNQMYVFKHTAWRILIKKVSEDYGFSIEYDSEKALLEQSEKAIKEIIDFIKANQ